jgi:hypothetical protein
MMYTVWICPSNGHGTTHVSAHDATNEHEAANAALDETLADWELPNAAVTTLHVLGIAEGDVKLVQWNDEIYG